jgi:nucleoside-diphosphate-sugar epimerase
MPATVALTGATGFIGGAISRQLLAGGIRVQALSRRPVQGGDGIEWIAGSLEDPGALSRLVAGADAVIHCAGAVRGASAATFRHTNVDGSRRLIAAARATGQCQRFLAMSSLAARHPDLSWYAASKRKAEEQLLAEAGDMALTLFRPTAVYGPGDRELRPLFEWLLRGWLIVPGRPDSCLTFLHVEDLAAAVMNWLTVPDPISGIFELHDGRPGGYDWPAIAATGELVRHGSVRSIAAPQRLLGGIATANLAFSRLFGLEPMLTPSKLHELRHPDWLCDNGPLMHALNWAPQLQLARALAERRF